ncbi:MAG: transcriptional regulator, LacI family [Clostridiaceae bacterium]|nr:transcriptional regulator, LacI family [Clostridiaceae bacterium]
MIKISVTINDIAKIAGVSPSTVSRVVNDSPLISEGTKKNIRTIMKDLKYFPNSIGKQLAKKSSFNIGFLINTSSKDTLLDQFFYNIIIGSQSLILPANYDLTICDTHYLAEHESFLERFVYSKKVDGLIIHSSILNKESIEELNSMNFPYVVLGQPAAAVNVSWVDIDNISACEEAVKFLIKKGYKYPAFIAGSHDEPISNTRLKGYTKAAIDLKIQNYKSLIRFGIGTEEDGYNLMKELLKSNTVPDSVICINNYTAFGALNAIKETFLEIPRDFGIITFDSYPLAPYTSPTITSIHINTFELGKLAAQVLLSKLSKTGDNNQVNMLLPEIMERQSTM